MQTFNEIMMHALPRRPLNRRERSYLAQMDALTLPFDPDPRFEPGGAPGTPDIYGTSAGATSSSSSTLQNNETKTAGDSRILFHASSRPIRVFRFCLCFFFKATETQCANCEAEAYQKHFIRCGRRISCRTRAGWIRRLCATRKLVFKENKL